MDNQIIADLIKKVTELHTDMLWVKRLLWFILGSNATVVVTVLTLLKK